MTREKAIKWLKVEASYIEEDVGSGKEMLEAYDMAIEALEQEPCDVFDKYGNYKYPSDVELAEPNTATSMPCEDAISR